jgi:hypothetical protein
MLAQEIVHLWSSIFVGLSQDSCSCFFQSSLLAQQWQQAWRLLPNADLLGFALRMLPLEQCRFDFQLRQMDMQTINSHGQQSANWARGYSSARSECLFLVHQLTFESL